MARARFAASAKLLKTLVNFDGPQLAILENNLQGKMLAVACDRRPYIYPFFAVEVSSRLLDRYMEQRVDLNYVFRHKEPFKNYYIFDWKDMKGMEITLFRALQTDLENDNLYPDPGFFARDHTAEYKLPRLLKSTEKVFGLDGKWNANDFSRFYARFAEIYAFALISHSNIRKKVSSFDLDIIQHAIANYAWAGGSSYISFYNNLMESVRALNPLNISRMKIASPGAIAFEGGKEALDEIAKVIVTFQKDSIELIDLNREIVKLLEREGLRGASADEEFSSDRTEKHAVRLADRLAIMLGIDAPSETFELCGSNSLVYIKVILSYFRRAKALSAFYAEGRVNLDASASILSSDATPER